MEFTFDRMMFLIETLRRCNKKGSEIHQYLITAWPEESVSVRQVQRLMSELSDGTRTTFQHFEKQGRPKSEARREAIQAVEEAIELDNTLSERSLAHMLNLNNTMVHRILNEDLEKLWVKTAWVPHRLSEAQRQLRVERMQDMLEAFKSRLVKRNLVVVDEKWFFYRYLLPRQDIGSWMSPEGDRRQTPRRLQTEPKCLCYVAVSLSGVHYFKVAEDNINSDAYIIFINEMCEHMKANAGIQTENMVLIQDNARPHVSKTSLDYFGRKNIRLLKQAPYSPDSNMLDRFIFPRLEAKRTQYQDFHTKDELQAFMNNELPTFTAEKMNRQFEELNEDLRKIIENNGFYL